MTDKIIATRICTKTGKEFSITENDAKFYKKLSCQFGDYVAETPFPTLCPEERERRRMAFRNERKLYRRMCDATKQPIISIYSPDKDYKVFDQKTRWSDSWSGLEYGRDFDFSKTFNEQFAALMSDVPRIGIMNDDGVGSENCGYCQDFAFGKNCYMCTGSRHLEDCLYCHFEACDSTHLIDCVSISGSHHCYNCSYCYTLYNCSHLERSNDCTDCLVGFNLVGCKDCIACYGLTNQQYCYQNKQLSQEEYEQVKGQVMKDIGATYNAFLNMVEELSLRKRGYQLQCEESTGDYLFGCNNVKESYGSHSCKDSKYLFGGEANDTCYDIVISGGGQLGYEGVTPDEGYKVLFSTFTWKSKYCLYTDICQSCSDCFGCVGLREKQYCIFNKQYTKEEYNALVPKIIEHMKTTGERGEFFDPAISPRGYNETIAQENYPLDESDAVQQGYTRSSFKSPAPQSDKIIEGEELPASIDQIDDVILRYAIRCVESGKLFRLQPQELIFYRKHGIPVPRKHPDQRYLDILKRK